jgi:pyrroline-5-carboxylate reductase
LSYKFWATASVMAAYYEILNVSANWLIKKGIKKNIANRYIAELFLSLSQDAVNKQSHGFKKLVMESQTPKGLNTQVLKELKKAKFYSKLYKSLDSINKRVSK